MNNKHELPTEVSSSAAYNYATSTRDVTESRKTP